VICRDCLRLSFALIVERLLNDCVSPSFFYIDNGKRRRIQPPDQNESVVVFTQPPRDELFSILNSDYNVPLTPLENNSIRKLIQEHPETCREKYPFDWYSEAYETFPLSRLCLRQATTDVIELAYNAHRPAIHDEDGWLPLQYACYAKVSLEMDQFLVERNPAALETADNEECLPLHLACYGNASFEVVQFLVERNPTALEAADHGGWLPLHRACRNNASLEVVQFLVERYPAALEMTNNSGDLPLHLACQTQASLEVAQFLVGRNPAALETASNYGRWPLHLACSVKASLEVVQFLVERHPAALLEAADSYGRLPCTCHV
jgi:ankyrin repeat protein